MRLTVARRTQSQLTRPNRDMAASSTWKQVALRAGLARCPAHCTGVALLPRTPLAGSQSIQRSRSARTQTMPRRERTSSSRPGPEQCRECGAGPLLSDDSSGWPPSPCCLGHWQPETAWPAMARVYSDRNSKLTGPTVTTILPGPSWRPAVGKKRAPSVESPGLTLPLAKVIAAAAADAFKPFGPKASADSLRFS